MKESHRTTGKSAFTLLEMLVVMAIISLLAALLIPLVLSAVENSRRAEVLDNVTRLSAVFETIKVEKGVYPEQEADENLTYDVSKTTPGILNNIVERYNYPISMERVDADLHFIDLWDEPIKYRKGDYANRIAKAARDPSIDLPQDTNKPIGDPSVDIAAESDWNPANNGGFAYIWSYGGDASDQSLWIYQKQ